MAFRHLEDLRDKHKGEEIWILGRGPSLDDFPPDFFDDKISIAVSYAYLAFPDCTYYHSLHMEPTEWVAKNWPDKLDRCILGCIQDPKPGDKQRRNRYEQSGKVPIYVKVKRDKGRSYEDLRGVVERILTQGSCELLNSTTTLRTAIQVAIVLGAAKITLVGCELEIREGLLHAKRTWVNDALEGRLFNRRGAWAKTRYFPGCRRDLGRLVEICKVYNIEIARYYYEKGYEQIETP